MSILTNKIVVIVGEDTAQLNNLGESLEAHGAILKKIQCEKVTLEQLESLKSDVVILNYLHLTDTCDKAFHLCLEFAKQELIPVFSLIDDSADLIQEVLSRGVTDYITAEEEVRSVLGKIKAVFGECDAFSGSPAIDITPTAAHVTTSGIRVFVVEDDPLLRNLLSMKMDRSQFPCEFSRDGVEALPLMHQFKPDVIILDLMLPGKSGFEVLAEIKADDRLKNVPVIVFSNRDGQDDRQKASELGAKGFYVKATTDLSELIETIESLVT